VLTTPIIRCLKSKYPDAEIHYLTKQKFKSILQYNPHLEKIHTFNASINECFEELKALHFDFIIDLHHNLRTSVLKFKLAKPSGKFDKLNFKKWLLVNFKINQMPTLHIVDRYFEVVKSLNVVKDNKGLDFFMPEIDTAFLSQHALQVETYTCIAIGAAHFTKQIPESKILEIIPRIKNPIVLLGDKNDVEKAKIIIAKSPQQNIINACGLYNLYESAYLVKHCQLLITADTGLMHIAAAFHKTIYSFWGNTVPEFGMTPYLPNAHNKIFEVKNLSCRPCSKIGFNKCPKGHFDCMEKMDVISNFD
jgi:ADP-heptose:LPS heptosyltransferase